MTISNLLTGRRLAASLVFLFFITPTFSATEKYRLIIRDNPSSTICLGWNQLNGNAPLVYYGEEDFGTDYQKYPHKHMPDRSVSFKGMDNKYARLDYLKPDTKYYFTIVDENSNSARFWFRTLPANATTRLSVVAGGDSRNNRDVRQNANLMVAKLRPHVVMFGGDMVRSGTNEQWQWWFDDWQNTTTSDGQMIPVIATRGNHEKSNEIVYNLFDTPSKDIFYAISFCKDLLRIYTLNTEISIKGDQTQWLRNDLEKNKHLHWKIAQYHKPMRPHVLRKYEGEDTYQEWASLFYQYRVKLAVECDAHTVKTTWPIRPEKTNWRLEGFVRDDENGTVYTGEGCWGAPTRPANDPKEWTRFSGEFNQFNWIFLDKQKIELRTVKVDNAMTVQALAEGDFFTIPQGIDLWKPGGEDVVTIYP